MRTLRIWVGVNEHKNSEFSASNSERERELYDNERMVQKLDYIHMNPVVSGFVNEPEHWRYSSAIDYAGGKGLLDVSFCSKGSQADACAERGRMG